VIPGTPQSEIAPLYQPQEAARGEVVALPNRLLTALPRRSTQQCPNLVAVSPKKTKTIPATILGKLKTNDSETAKALT